MHDGKLRACINSNMLDDKLSMYKFKHMHDDKLKMKLDLTNFAALTIVSSFFYRLNNAPFVFPDIHVVFKVFNAILFL